MPNMNMNTTTTQSSTNPSGKPTASNNTVVLILNYAYVPAQLTIAAGTTVTWMNKDSVGHTVTQGNPESPKSSSGRVFDSSHGTSGADVITIPPGESWSFTFATPGEYDYYCVPHPYMRGHISVLPSGTSGSQSYGYGDLSNFYVVLTGREVIALTAFGILVLVGVMLVFSRPSRKREQNTH
jgi:plastocyanin